jgi:hypothetical protein
MTRLGHISFFGIALINISYALTVKSVGADLSSPAASWLLVTGAVTMPLVCYLSSVKMSFRHLFPIPVISLVVGIGLVLYGVLTR